MITMPTSHAAPSLAAPSLVAPSIAAPGAATARSRVEPASVPIFSGLQRVGDQQLQWRAYLASYGAGLLPVWLDMVDRLRSLGGQMRCSPGVLDDMSARLSGPVQDVVITPDNPHQVEGGLLAGIGRLQMQALLFEFERLSTSPDSKPAVMSRLAWNCASAPQDEGVSLIAALHKARNELMAHADPLVGEVRTQRNRMLTDELQRQFEEVVPSDLTGAPRRRWIGDRAALLSEMLDLPNPLPGGVGELVPDDVDQLTRAYFKARQVVGMGRTVAEVARHRLSSVIEETERASPQPWSRTPPDSPVLRDVLSRQRQVVPLHALTTRSHPTEREVLHRDPNPLGLHLLSELIRHGLSIEDPAPLHSFNHPVWGRCAMSHFQGTLCALHRLDVAPVEYRPLDVRSAESYWQRNRDSEPSPIGEQMKATIVAAIENGHPGTSRDLSAFWYPSDPIPVPVPVAQGTMQAHAHAQAQALRADHPDPVVPAAAAAAAAPIEEAPVEEAPIDGASIDKASNVTLALWESDADGITDRLLTGVERLHRLAARHGIEATTTLDAFLAAFVAESPSGGQSDRVGNLHRLGLDALERLCQSMESWSALDPKQVADSMKIMLGLLKSDGDPTSAFLLTANALRPPGHGWNGEDDAVAQRARRAYVDALIRNRAEVLPPGLSADQRRAALRFASNQVTRALGWEHRLLISGEAADHADGMLDLSAQGLVDLFEATENAAEQAVDAARRDRR
jgi:hypothetical protein